MSETNEEPLARGGGADAAATLRTVVDSVRRVMRADTAGVASFSHDDRTITWKAISGFQMVAAEGATEIVKPLRGEFAELAANAEEPFIEVRGLAGDLPASEFPLHSQEGVRDLALVPLAARGERLGVLAVGFREPHRFTAEERQLLEALAEMAALALDNARLIETISHAKRVWEQTFDAIPDGIIVHDEAMRVTRCNLAAAEMMGFAAPSEAIGMSCGEAFARLFGERAAAFHMKQGAVARTATAFELQAEDGRRYLVSVSPLASLESGVWSETGAGGRGPGAGDERIPSSAAAHQDVSSRAHDDANRQVMPTPDPRPPAPDQQTSWSVISWSDITELSEIQEQLARSRRLATVGQLAAGVAHEINNPLAAITTCAEAITRDLRSAPELSAAAEERNWNFYLEEIVRQALRGKAITRGLLDLSRQHRARRESCDLNALVARAVRLFEEGGRGQGVAVEVETSEEVGEVATDESMVRQIIDNFILNAIDAAGRGGRVRVRTAAEGARVLIEVEDTGPGIAPDSLARIFDPFYTTKDPGSGSGLGLAISLSLAEALGGAITVESKSGTGSRFRLWIPRRTPEGK